ncbi:MAG: heavy-metal-associated domain-containing protein [Chloroflexi bacterium]|nr:heavy-metal-associated domain-containing protein [Chloroflexota bacterium]
MPQRVTLEAPNISCDHCINAIRKAVTALPGVQFLEGDPASKRVTLEYDPAQAALPAIEQAMAEEGYPVRK